jgi:hypothetical protein
MFASVKAMTCFRKSTRSCLVALVSSADAGVTSDIAVSIVTALVACRRKLEACGR